MIAADTRRLASARFEVVSDARARRLVRAALVVVLLVVAIAAGLRLLADGAAVANERARLQQENSALRVEVVYTSPTVCARNEKARRTLSTAPAAKVRRLGMRHRRIGQSRSRASGKRRARKASGGASASAPLIIGKVNPHATATRSRTAARSQPPA